MGRDYLVSRTRHDVPCQPMLTPISAALTAPLHWEVCAWFTKHRWHLKTQLGRRSLLIHSIKEIVKFSSENCESSTEKQNKTPYENLTATDTCIFTAGISINDWLATPASVRWHNDTYKLGIHAVENGISACCDAQDKIIIKMWASTML